MLIKNQVGNSAKDADFMFMVLLMIHYARLILSSAYSPMTPSTTNKLNIRIVTSSEDTFIDTVKLC